MGDLAASLKLLLSSSIPYTAHGQLAKASPMAKSKVSKAGKGILSTGKGSKGGEEINNYEQKKI